MKHRIPKFLSIAAIFFVAFFFIGLIAGRNDRQTADIMAVVLGGTTTRINEGNTELLFKCPGTGTLFTYIVGEDKPKPHMHEIGEFLRNPPIAIASIKVPPLSTGLASDILGAFGLKQLYDGFVHGSLQQKEWMGVALGIVAGVPLGYVVGYRMIGIGCESGQKFIEEVEKLDWPKVAKLQ